MAESIRPADVGRELREQLSAQARVRAARHDWSLIVELYEKAYNDARESCAVDGKV